MLFHSIDNYHISASWQSYTRPLPQVVTYDLDPVPDGPPTQWVAPSGGSQSGVAGGPHSVVKTSHGSKLYGHAVISLICVVWLLFTKWPSSIIILHILV